MAAISTLVADMVAAASHVATRPAAACSAAPRQHTAGVRPVMTAALLLVAAAGHPLVMAALMLLP